MPRVLIVEDETELLNVYKTTFSAAGYEVDTASDGRQALEALKAAKPDVVLMDIMMPNLNGMDTLKAIKADPTLKEIMIVMLTNLSGASDKQQAIQAGAADLLVKSDFTPPELVQKINAMLAPKPIAQTQQGN